MDLPSYEAFCEGLGLRGEFFTSDLILVQRAKGRFSLCDGVAVVKLYQGWKTNGSVTLELSGQLLPLNKEGQVGDIPVEGAEVVCTVQRVAAGRVEHHVRCSVPAKVQDLLGETKCVLRVFARVGHSRTADRILDFCVDRS